MSDDDQTVQLLRYELGRARREWAQGLEDILESLAWTMPDTVAELRYHLNEHPHRPRAMGRTNRR